MAKRRLIWETNAARNRRKLLKYWTDRTKSKVYSKKLNKLFSNSVKHLIEFPDAGKNYEKTNFRYLIVKDYLIFYKYDNSFVTILKVWDGNRDPKTLKIEKL